MRRARTARPLDAGALERLALRYVERYATTRARLAAYLGRKLRERGWEGGGPAPDPAALAARMAARGYVDDQGYAETRASAMARRGLGGRRIAMALRHAGIEADDLASLEEAIDAGGRDAALTFARRRRIGPFAPEPADRDKRERQIAAMIRAGHSPQLARKIVSMRPGECDEALAEAD